MGLVIGELKADASYHVMYWMSHKSKRPVKSVKTAEIWAASEGTEKAKTIAHDY